jgi:hypothetical protein
MSTSPIPVRTIMALTFPEAMQAVIDGKHISKLEWENKDHFAELRNGSLMIHLANGWHTWTVSEGDMMGTDWVTL